MEHSAFECVRCGVHLPLRRDLAADDPETWICANCGWQMPGELDPAARDSIQGNAFPLTAESAVEIRRRVPSGSFEPLLKQLLGRFLMSASVGAGSFS